MKGKKSFCLLAVLMLMLLVTFQEAGAEDVIKIGSLCTTSGPAASLGTASLNGATLAVEDLNAKGGITVDGKTYLIELINYDDKCVAKDAVSATERLIRQDKVPVILGAICSHCTLAAMEPCEREKLPIVCAISASLKITGQGYKYIFRTAATAAHQAEAITWFAYEDLKKRRAAFVGRNDAWSRAAADQFKLRFEKRGGEVVVTEFFELGSTDFYPQLTKVKEANPDFVYFCALAEDGGLLYKQARELGIEAQLMSATPDQREIELAGAAIEGSYHYYDGGPSTPQIKDYEERYEKRFDTKSLFFDLATYDTFMLIAKAFEQAGTATDTEKLRDALSKTDYDGIKQHYAFDENGQGKIDMWITTVENGKLKHVKQVPLYENPALPF